MRHGDNDHGRSGDHGRDDDRGHEDRGHHEHERPSLVLGTRGDDVLIGTDHNDFVFGFKGNDVLDGGAGSDWVFGGRGDDILVYSMSGNLGPGFTDAGARDYYDGGSGHDTLKLELTYGEAALPAVQKDIAALQAYLDALNAPKHGHGHDDDHGRDHDHDHDGHGPELPPLFHFTSFDLTLHGIEAVTIDLVNHAPVAADDAGATDADTALAVDAAHGVLANDSDPDHLDVLSIAGFDAASAFGAAVSVAADGSYSYDPTGSHALQALAQGEIATDSFQYTIVDLAGASSSATVEITVTGVNQPPVAAPDAFTLAEDTPLAVPGPGVLANDTDPDGDAMSALLVDGPAHGTLALNADGSFDYAPNADYNGADAFSYRANDGNADSSTVEVSLTVSEVNDAPLAADDYATTKEDTALTIDVLGNDSAGPANESGQTLTVIAASAAHGTVTINPDGTLDYLPEANAFGEFTISYTISDDGTTAGAADPKTANAAVHLIVDPVNDAPVAVPDAFTLAEDTALAVTAPGVLANDSDVEGDALRALLSSGPSHGTLALNVDGSFDYTPDPDYNGSDSFSYRANDGAADSAAVEVSLTVSEVNDAPLAADDYAETKEDTALTIDVLGNDSAGPANESGQTLTVIAASAAHGTVTINPDGTLDYLPEANAFGEFTINYTISDDGTTAGAADPKTANAAVHLIVDPVNDAPVALPDAYTVTENTVLTVAAPGLLANDSDVEGDPLHALLSYTPMHGTLSFVSDGSFTYTPNADYVGSDVFGYRANDSHTDSATVNVSLTVSAPPSGGGGSNIAPSVDADTHVEYYILFDGVGEGKWLKLGDFNLGFDVADGGHLGGGGGAGKVTASDVLSELGASGTATALSTVLLSGELVKDVQIEAYVSNGAAKGGMTLIDEFKFTDVLVKGLDTAVSANSYANDVSFEFAQFSHSEVSVDTTGKIGLPVSVGWDAATGAVSNGYGVSSGHVNQNTLAPSVDDDRQLQYFVHFDGVAHDDWLRLDSFSMGLANSGTMGGSGGGAVAGKAISNGAEIGLGSSAGVVQLSESLLKGEHIQDATVEVYANVQGKMEIVDEFKFTDVVLAQLQSQGAVDNTLAFDFAKYSHGHVDINPDGSAGLVTGEGWDFHAGQEASGLTPHADVDVDAASNVAPSVDAGTHYYILFDGVGEGKWLKLGDFNLGFDVADGGHLGGGGGAGKVTASDVLSELGASGTATALSTVLLSGELVKDVQIEAYVSNGAAKGGMTLIDEFKFTDVLVKGLDTAVSANSYANDVSFEFAQFSHSEVSVDTTGKIGLPVSVGWDAATGAVSNGYGVSSGHVNQNTLAPSVDDDRQLQYFVHFDGVAHDDWLRLDSFSMGLANSGTMGGSGGGAVAGKAISNGAEIGLGSSAGVVQLSESLLKGEHIQDATVEVYANVQGKMEIVDEFKFTDVVLARLQSQGAVDNTLAFDFAKYSHGHVDINPDGSAGLVTGEGWDFHAGQEASGLTPHADVDVDAASNVAPSVDAGTHYYILFDGVGEGKWLKLGDFNLGFDVADGGHLGGGGGAGKVTASDVLSELGASGTATALSTVLLSGELVKDVQIEAYVSNGAAKGGMTLIDEFKFTDVLVKGLDTAVSANSYANDVSFEFAQFSHSEVSVDTTGKIGLPVSVGWDAATGAVSNGYGVSSGHVNQNTLAPSVDDDRQLQYFVHFDGVAHDDWLRLDSFSMGLANSGTMGGTGGGAVAGKAISNGAEIGLGSSAGVVQLSESLLKGEHIQDATVEVYANVQGKMEIVDEFKFTDVTLTGLQSNGAVDNTLAFDFAKYSHGHVDINPDGSAGLVTGEGWDFHAGQEASGLTPHADVDLFS